ncbi:MAG: hypothetical protein QG570_55 [Patescibacteria group bacterium]|nr:hypothetical protein [Patescibacteria group bacterium]
MVTFYSVQIKASVEVEESAVEVVTMKNGRLAAKAVLNKDGKELKLFKILSKDEAERLQK